MQGSILVTSTRPGVRPLGVRGEPLHNAQAQLRAVVRRRLGDRHFNLLAEPQAHALGGRIDWYCATPGTVRPLAGLPEADRDAARAGIDALLADIDRTGQALEQGPTEDGRLAGRSLRLAARRPNDEYLFLVGDQPVVVCWGYEVEAAGAVLPNAFTPAKAQPDAPAPVVPEAWAPAPVAAQAGASPAVAAVAAFPWLFWLLAALLAIALLMAASWLLRQCMPVEADLRVTELPPPPPPPPPPPVYNPIPDLERALAAARDEDRKLRATLAALRDDLVRRLAECKKPEIPADDWEKRNLGVLEGCWVMGRDLPARLGTSEPPIRGVFRAARLCFDRSGRGRYETRFEYPGYRPQECKTDVTAAFKPDGTVGIRQPRADCSGGQSYLDDDTFDCRRRDDGTAICRSRRFGEMEFRREER